VFTGLHIERVAIDPSKSLHEFAATDGGLFVTTDGGTSWAKPTDASYASVDGNVSSVAVDPATPSTVYIGGGQQTVAKSTDGGIHWAAANIGIVTLGLRAPLTAIAVAPSSPSTLYASVGSESPVALYKSTNGGGIWTPLLATPDFTGFLFAYGSGSGEQGWYDNVLAVDPANADHVLAGGVGLVSTTNGGLTWTNVNGQAFFDPGTNKLHPDFHALAFRPDGSVWVGDDGGVFHYTPSSGAVSNVNGNLNVTQFYFGFNAVGNTVLAGSQDNSSARTASGSQAAWTGLYGGDGGPSAITPNDTQVQFIEADQRLLATTDGFATTLNDITPPELGLFTPPMIVVPNTTTPANPTVFYGGGSALWRTTNPTAASPTWTSVTAVGAPVSAIAASPTNPQVIYVGFTNGTIEVSTNGGVSFASLAAANSPEPFVTGLSVDPGNAKAITASFSYNDTRYRGGFPHVEQFAYSTDPGTGTWTTITGNLPSAAVSRVVYDNGALVAATDGGAFATGAPAGGSTAWTKVGTGLPNVQVQDLYLQGNDLYAVTHGRGAWKLSPSGIVPGAPTIGQATAANAQASVTFTPPSSDGSSPITSYTATATDHTNPAHGGQTQTGTASPITVTGLTNGDSYTFAVTATNATGTGPPSAASNAVTPATVPGAPIIGQATAANASASVAFGPPASTGGSPITSYTATATDHTNAAHGGQTQTGPASPLTVTGLTNGDSYTFTVTAKNAIGTGPASAASNAVTPTAPEPYHPLTPARITDTRTGSGLPNAGKTLGPATTLDVQVTGAGGVPPTGATAVVLNVTATGPTASSYLTVWPTGASRPTASNLNFGPGQTVPNLVEVGLGTNGKVSLFNAGGNVDVVVDVEGYVGPSVTTGTGLYNPLTPTRITDTRTGSGLPNAGKTLGPSTTLNVKVTGVGGVPGTGVGAVVLNVTATGPTQASYLTAWPTGATQPTASNVNFVAGQTVPNRVMVPVGSNGQVSIFNAGGSVDVVVDVGGYFTDNSNLSATGAKFTPLTPTRITDTRTGSGLPNAGKTLGPAGTLPVQVSGAGGVPATGVSAAVMNVTVTNATQSSYLTAWPTGATQPTASDLNWVTGQTVPNLGVVKLGSGGSIQVFNAAGSVDVIVDVSGWYS
jgi:hypothetical protein